jgi:hypothetical protein
MRHILLFEQYTGSYKPPKFVFRPAADDTGYAMVAKYYGATPGPKGKKKGQKTQEVAVEEKSVEDVISSLIKSAKKAHAEKEKPSIDDILNASPQIIVQNMGNKLVYFEHIMDEERLKNDESIKKFVKNQVARAAHKAGEEITGIDIKTMDGEKVLVVNMTNS